MGGLFEFGLIAGEFRHKIRCLQSAIGFHKPAYHIKRRFFPTPLGGYLPQVARVNSGLFSKCFTTVLVKRLI